MSLYRFKSRETGDVVMTEPHGRRILEVLGKDLEKGLIQPEEVPGAIIALRRAADEEAVEQMRQREAAEANGEVPPEFDPVGFRQRIVPLIDMLHRCEAANVPVVWGV